VTLEVDTTIAAGGFGRTFLNIKSPGGTPFAMDQQLIVNSSGGSFTYPIILQGIVPAGWAVEWGRDGSSVSGPSTAKVTIRS
jgi:hypothetical protein